jgi:Ca2+-binding EF-hand superfamily protein
VTISYYLQDNSVAVDEPKTKNSGLPQGRFMRRMGCMTTNEDGSERPFQVSDFNIGEDIVINARTFVITDADERTRKYCRDELGQPLPPGMRVPDDGYADLRKSRGIPKKKQGGAPRMKGEFFNKDLLVLCFKCAYQDDKLYGERRDYLLYYYVLNDTVEIKEVAAQGRHNFPNLLRRQKLPKNSFYVPNGIGGAIEQPSGDGQREQCDWITYRDLICGRTLSVYGRKVLLVSCDNRTVDWFAKQGITQKPLKLSVEETEGSAGPKVPAYNGYGSEDDLYAMGASLEPKIIDRKLEDFARFMRAKGKVLRFLAKLSDANGQDKDREFVINYFLATDQVSVYEPPIRNSGIVGGLFLGKGRYKKFIRANGIDGEVETPVGGGRGGRGGALSRWIKPTDFYLDALVTFEMPSTGSKLFTLQVTGYDDYTKKIMENDKEEFPQSNTELDIVRLSEKVTATKLPIRGILHETDHFGTRLLPAEDFKKAIRDIEREADNAGTVKIFDISEGELDQLVSDFGVETDEYGMCVHYDDLVDLMVLAAPRTAREYERDRQGTFAFSVEERMLKVMRTHFETAGTSKLRQSFRALDQGEQGFIDQEAYKTVLRKHKFHLIMTERAADALRMQYDTNADGTLDYNAMCDAIHPGDFDKYVDAYIGPKKYGETQKVGGPKNPLASTIKTAGEGLTTEEYLKNMNEANFSFGGDLIQQLTRAFNCFSSCFARHNRKKQLRKHMMAFDIYLTGMVTRAQFLVAIDLVTAEFFIDFDKRDRDLIVDYFFHNDEVKVPFDRLLEAICTRNPTKATALREESMRKHVDVDKQFMIVDEQRARDFGGTLNLFSG